MENILILPGDGIGPEVMGEVARIIDWFGTHKGFDVSIDQDLVGGCAYDAHGAAISDAAMEKALAADAVLLGAVGGPQWDNVAYEARPEAGLLRLRADLELFANLRPAICFSALAEASSLKRELVEGLDIMIVRELTGGVYFGEPRGITDLGNGQRRGVNTQVYETYEIERITRVAADIAMKRTKSWQARKNAMSWKAASSGLKRSIGLLPPIIRKSNCSMCWPIIAPCNLCASRSNMMCW